MNYPINNIIQYPSGRWGFVGRVSPKLAYVNKDGSELSESEVIALLSCSNPGFLAKGRTFNTRAEAIVFAIENGLKVTE